MRRIGLHPKDWTKYVRVVGESKIPFMGKKGTCNKSPNDFCC